MADPAKGIGRLSADLHANLVTFGKRYAKTSDILGKTVKQYNDGAGSWDYRIMPAAGKLVQASVSTDELPEAKQVDTAPRRLAGR